MIHTEPINEQENVQQIIAILSTDQKARFGADSPTEEQTFSLGLFEDTTYIGGIVANKFGNTTHISLLGLIENYRKQGFGTTLLKAAETFALEAHSEIITVNTQDYQAKEFYQKFGYQIFGQLADSPFAGTTKYYLAKYIKKPVA